MPRSTDLPNDALVDLLGETASSATAAARRLVTGAWDLIDVAHEQIVVDCANIRYAADQLRTRAANAGHAVAAQDGAVYPPLAASDDRRLCKEMARHLTRAHTAARTVATAIRMGMPNDVSADLAVMARAADRCERIAGELARRRSAGSN